MTPQDVVTTKLIAMDPVVLNFMLAAITAMAGFIAFIFKKIFDQNKEIAQVMQGVKSSMDNFTITVQRNTDLVVNHIIESKEPKK